MLLVFVDMYMILIYLILGEYICEVRDFGIV